MQQGTTVGQDQVAVATSTCNAGEIVRYFMLLLLPAAGIQCHAALPYMATLEPLHKLAAQSYVMLQQGMQRAPLLPAPACRGRFTTQ
jgi:hypothetical protein